MSILVNLSNGMRYKPKCVASSKCDLVMNLLADAKYIWNSRLHSEFNLIRGIRCLDSQQSIHNTMYCIHNTMLSQSKFITIKKKLEIWIMELILSLFIEMCILGIFLYIVNFSLKNTIENNVILSTAINCCAWCSEGMNSTIRDNIAKIANFTQNILCEHFIFETPFSIFYLSSGSKK